MQVDGEVGPSREIGFTMRNPVKKSEDQQLSRPRYREGEGNEVEVMLVDDRWWRNNTSNAFKWL